MLKQNKWILPVILGILAVCALVAGYRLSLPQGDELPASLTIAPASGQNASTPIQQTESFQLVLDFSVTEEQLRKMLTVSPAFAYTLEGSGKSWVLSPNVPLEKNTIVTFQVAGSTGTVSSYAFQTESDLLVSGVYPENGATYLDVNTVVEMSFNHTGVRLDNTVFEILPAVSGKFESAGYKARFLPTEPLSPGTVYRVTLKSGLENPSGAVLREDYTFTFSTIPAQEEKKLEITRAGHLVIDALPGEEVFAGFWVNQDVSSLALQMDLYRFPGVNTFASAVKGYDQYSAAYYGEITPYTVATDGLGRVFSQSDVTLTENDQGRSGVYLPKGLSEGWYILCLTGEYEGNPVTVQQLVQISAVSLFSQSAQGDALFWLNDPVTAMPMSGAELTVELYQQAGDTEKTEHRLVSNSDGLARLSTREAETGYLRIVRDGTPVYFSSLYLSPEAEEQDLGQLYRMSLFTDREIYQPGDDIQFWGVLAPRRDNVQMVGKAWLSLGTAYPESEITRIPVDVDADGVFSGVLPIAQLRGDYYRLSLLPYEDSPGSQEDTVPYVAKSLSIQQYEKPPYTITLSTNKDVYKYNEQVTFTVQGAYYDGTPLAGGEFTLECYQANLSGTRLVLDENGVGTLTGRLDPARFRPGSGQVVSWEPVAVSWGVTSADEVNANLSQWDTFSAMPSLYAVRLTYGTEDGVLEVRTAHLDENKIGDANQPRPWSYWASDAFDRLAGTAADLPLSLIIHRVEYTRYQSGTRYDPINKENRPLYRYDRQETVLETRSLQTSGGRASTVFTYEQEENVYYWYELRLDGGVEGQVSTSLSGSIPYPGTDRASYSFFGDDVMGELVVKSGQTLNLVVHENGVPVKSGDFVLGQTQAQTDSVPEDTVEAQSSSTGGQEATSTAEAVLLDSSVPIEESGHSHTAGLRALYALVQNDHVDFAVLGGVSGEAVMKENFPPNVRLTGAFFDGQRVHIMETVNLVFDYTNETLDIQLSTDKEAYKPGEEARIAVSVKNAQGVGEQASGVIAVVDEAIFDLRQQRVDLAGALYGQIFTGSIRSVVSHSTDEGSSLVRAYGLTMDTAADGANTGKEIAAAAEAGGGDGQVRSVFADTAAVVPFASDENGTGQVTFTLPDNLTSWRFTALAVTPEQKAGSSATNYVTTLPFYVNPVVSDRYISGDSLALTLRSASAEISSLEEEAQVNYRVTLQDASGKAIATESVFGGILDSLSVDFGAWAAGQYSLLIEGSWKGHTDAMLLPVQVSDSGFYAPTRRIMSLAQLESLQSEAYPITLTFFDVAQKTAYEALAQLTSQWGSRRTELLAADYGATLYLESLSENPAAIAPVALLEEMQNQDGGVRALPAGESEPALTAKILLILPELLNTGKVKDYFYSILEGSATSAPDRAAAYLGLAAAGEPILTDLQRMLTDEGLSILERLYLATACAVLGDYDAGSRLVTALSQDRQIRQEGGMVYVEGNGTLEERLQLTEALLYLSAAARLEECDGVAAFFLAQDRDRARLADVFCEPALLYYAQNTHVSAADAAVTYTVQGGEEIRLSLGDTGAVSHAFDYATLKSANFTAHGGEIYVAASYFSPATPGESYQNIQVEKTYQPVSGESHRLGGRTRVEITVTLPADAAAGLYTLSDAIPSGMRYLPLYNGGYGLNTVYAHERESMNMEAMFYYAPEEDEQTKSASSTDAVSGETAEVVVEAGEAAKQAEAPSTTASKVYKIVYYLSNPIAGSFSTQPAVITTPQGQQASSTGGSVVISKNH